MGKLSFKNTKDESQLQQEEANTKDESQLQQEEDSIISNVTQTKNSIYFVGGEKGGVGKSFFSKCFIDYCINKGWGDQLTLIEADPTINDVSSTYPENHNRLTFSDNKFARDEPSIIIDKAESKTVIVNLPANICRQFDEWIINDRVLSLEAKDYYDEIVYFFVSDGCYWSIERFLAQLKNYSMQSLPHCLVLNPGRLTCYGDFSYLQEFKPLMKALKNHEIPIICLPELSAKMQFECDRDSLTYREMGEQSNQKFYAKQNIKDFLDKIDELFDEIFVSQINSPQGLSKIYQAQRQYIQKGKLPPNIVISNTKVVR